MADTPRRPTIEELRSTTLAAREPEVEVPSSFPVWAQLLAGPVIWLLHFLTVYFVSEFVCADVNYDYTNAFSPSTLRTFIYVATAIAALACFAMAIRGYRRITGGDRSFINRVGAILSFGSGLAVILIGISAVWVGTC